MPKTEYIDLYDISNLQRTIMVFVGEWVYLQKTPIPQKEIVEKMKSMGIKDFTAVNAINALLRKGYLRRAVITSNKTFYVQLRSV